MKCGKKNEKRDTFLLILAIYVKKDHTIFANVVISASTQSGQSKSPQKRNRFNRKMNKINKNLGIEQPLV